MLIGHAHSRYQPMLFHIIKKEVVNNVLSFRFAITYALLFGLVLLAVILMANEYGARQREYASTYKKERARIDQLQRIEDPRGLLRAVGDMPFSGLRQPQSASILARGLEGEVPIEVPAQGAIRGLSGAERAGRNALREIFQAPDFAYVVNVVMSLLALLFVFDSVSGEKEQGTLKLLLAHSLPRDTVLLGKWIGGYISLATPFSVAVLAGFIYVYASGALNADGLWRFVLIYGLSLVYISAFFTLGLMISTLAHRTSTALLIALLVWICWILVVPNVAPVVARLAAPVPSRQVIESEKAAIAREADLLVAGISKRKVYGDEQESERIRRDAEGKMRKLDQFYSERLQVQIELTQNLARLSPSASFLFAATRLAGTGPVLAEYFDQAMTRYQHEHRRFRRELYAVTIGDDRRESDWLRAEDLPRFSVALEQVADSLAAALFDVLLLLVFNVLFFMLAYTFFLRYDVT